LAEAAVAAGTRKSGTSKQQALLQEVQKDSRPLAAALEQALALEW